MKCSGCQCELLAGESDLGSGTALTSPATGFLGVDAKEQMFHRLSESLAGVSG